MTLDVRTIDPAEHLAFLESQSSASFLQTPAWASVKSEWASESLGWFRDGKLVGTGLVLHRSLPKLKRTLAYLPEGPVIDWETDDLAGWLDPMVANLKKSGAFAVRMGPPVVVNRWEPAAIKAGIADDEVTSLSQVPPAQRNPAGARVLAALSDAGWLPQGGDGGFAAGQPSHVFAIPLTVDGRPRTEDEVLKGMNQLWRRNIKKAAKQGVEVDSVAGSEVDEAALVAFHNLYVHTAERDGFTPRPKGYFATMFASLGAEAPERIRLWRGTHEGDLIAATISVQVGGHVWYSYGASSTEKRDMRGSNAVQWEMIRHALASGAHTYDLRGITDTLDADSPHVGLMQFKVGTGGEAVEYVGEWDLPLNRLLYRGFQTYLKRR